MFSSIKYYMAAAIAAVVAGLWIALKVVAGQRDKARDRAEREERRADTAKVVREKEQAISKAQAEARSEAKEIEDEEKNRIAAGDRPDTWGDSRLREKD